MIPDGDKDFLLDQAPPQRLVMVRPDLENLPGYPLPSGYSLRWFQPGDDVIWTRIQLAADPFNKITPSLFTREFGTDCAVLAERQCYLLDPQGLPIGTASAWFNPTSEKGTCGRMHWVAILPEFQGRGLAKPLLATVCRRLKELGHTRAYLTTSTARVAAIHLYRRFGFVPWKGKKA